MGIRLFLNGKAYEVDETKHGPEYKLVDFIRDGAGLKGTKYMCREGGCGACVVSVREKHPVSGKVSVRAVNSCLTPLLCCDGWDVATIEGLGSQKRGLHPIQKRMVEYSGAQCGFCTSGMIMSMHSLMENEENQVKTLQVDKSLDGNICRCTGYRPILDAFKSLTIDASEEIKSRCADIENFGNRPCTFNCKGCPEENSCKREALSKSKFILEIAPGQRWVNVHNVSDVLEIFHDYEKSHKKYRLVAGNTGTGVYKDDGPYQDYVDIGNIIELKQWSVDLTGVTLGAAVTITDTIEILKKHSNQEGLGFGVKVAEHLERVANVPVRNRATIGGNLMIKHTHKEFPSDVFLLLETLGSKIRIASGHENPKMYNLAEFLNLDMYGKVILSVHIPQRKNGYFFRSFKITRRYQNSHAYVNAGFLFKLDSSKPGFVSEKPRIVYGGINNSFVHASATENFLHEKNLNDPQVLKGALDALEKEVRPDFRPIDGTEEYRKLLTKSLLYKVMLELVGDKADQRLQSGSECLKRNISVGQPRYDTEKSDQEFHGSAKKLELAAQTTGEAQYINDIPILPNELHAAYVLSTVGKAYIEKVDPSEALRMKGVVAFIGADDIPNKKSGNNSMPFGIFPINTVEPIFADKEVQYSGQPLGLILAEDRETALTASKAVKVSYRNVEKPMVSIWEAYKKAQETGAMENSFVGTFRSAGDAKVNNGIRIDHEIHGEFTMGAQAHFHMETQSCVCRPVEDGFEIDCGTQWTDHTVTTVANALGVPTNRVTVKVKRVGGSFGARITRASGMIAACAVASNVVNRPVRFVMDMESNMAAVGKRLPYLICYEVGFDNDGRIGKLKLEAICDMGYSANEPCSALILEYIQSVYKAINWEVKPGFLTTNTHANTFMRSPGMIQGIACSEIIMDHIAYKLNKDPVVVRMNNLASSTDYIFPTAEPLKGEESLAKKIIDEIIVSGDYQARRKCVLDFNANNRWKKRGISLVPVRHAVGLPGVQYPVFVTTNHVDGYVQVSHGGVEIGQGINTKVAQTVAHALNIPLDHIIIRPTESFTGNNTSFTGGSVTSDSCCDAALKACKILLERMEPIKKKLEEEKKTSWKEIVAASYADNINLSVSYMHGSKDGVERYFVWLASLIEVEIDILTGEYKIVRADLIEDIGKSLNPLIDLGQIEGGFVMGLGLWTTENIAYDKDTGKMLTDRTWTYKVPESKDIPEDFRVKLFSSMPNPKLILGSKATGEPPLCASVSVFLALKQAIFAARQDVGKTDWINIDSPITPNDVCKLASVNSEDFTY